MWNLAINKYDSCIGIDINSKGDGRTRYDRKLWDILLSKVVLDYSCLSPDKQVSLSL